MPRLPSSRRGTTQIALGVFVWTLFSCSGTKRYYLSEELRRREDNSFLSIAPGPWPDVPSVIEDVAHVPDDLVLSTLSSLMGLPGAADACDASTGRPRADATEYCVALYRTPRDWRVSWPVRSASGASKTCWPPFGGVDDADFGDDLPVFGYAHNHPCGTGASSQDLESWPRLKAGEEGWVLVAYAATPSGRLARDSRGEPIPAWGWLATGPRSAPRFYKWNQSGAVFRWTGRETGWTFQATCHPASSNILRRSGVMPKCTPDLIW
ncbi:hypothetical protein COCOR_03952 [Corallococcus coralloides DSM 2259]|uniref:JAB domain-containing protein n=1 Tax=Corallococcus coralloides (strain ATCC 25202 / DSM 2259 / NBRC 100086 / M2) TaxID=1144275 RepID=H8MU41_CORCM|nr:hypothetical protein COCOR_03952 [Corallococcus coralloides DSM 2259]